MRLIVILSVVFQALSGTAQTQSAADALIYPVNPPLQAVPQGQPTVAPGDSALVFQPLISEKETALQKALAEGLAEEHPDIQSLRMEIESLKEKSHDAERDIVGFLLRQEAGLQRQISRANTLAKQLAETLFLKEQEISQLKARIAELEAESNAKKSE